MIASESATLVGWVARRGRPHTWIKNSPGAPADECQPSQLRYHASCFEPRRPQVRNPVHVVSELSRLFYVVNYMFFDASAHICSVCSDVLPCCECFSVVVSVGWCVLSVLLFTSNVVGVRVFFRPK